MELKKKVPGVRFKGFSGEWEEKVLGELAAFTKGFGYSKNDLVETGTPIVLYGRLYTNYQSVVKNVDTYALAQKNSLYSNGSEVIVPASGETAEDIARASAILEKGVLLGGDLNVIYPEKMLNSIFLALRISNGKPQSELAKKAQGKSVVHLRNNDLKEVSINYPCITEQSRIGTFFQHLDQLITLHQKKYNKLTNIKKAMLEKMFPKNGADVPEIRFEGFEGKWEEKKLNQVSEIIGGGTPSTTIPEFWDGDIDWYSPTEIGDKVYVEGSVKKITALGLENSSAKILPANKTVLFTSRAGIGDMAILRKDGATNQGFQSFVIKEDNDPYFVYSKGHLIKDYALKHASGSTFLEISGKQLGNMNLSIPSAEEQQKIGTYFQNLDQLITLQQTQIEKLQNIKNACLEKMFV